ncbi:phage recombination protein Bet [Bosea eneae]|uniref:Phage recombination protein Bet n=1 Tax=Bosea eneae TaxID=151454 RepID=A0ABW0J0Q8_9HYPH
MNALVELQPPRLPYHAAVQDRFGVDKSGWKALVEAVYPLAKTPDSVVMALSYCKARKLDPFKKPVHIVPMWDSKKRDYVETIWPGISEVRTTAFRTGQYAGCDEAEFGPTIEKTFTGKVKKRGNGGDSYEEQTVEVAFPEWCRMTVYRVLGDRVCKFVGPKVKWLESYATIGNTDLPNDMWQSRPEGQIEKCAEAAALRKAFPEELGNQLTAEEMEGRRVEGDVAVADVADAAQRRLPPAPPAARQITHVETVDPETGEIQQDEPARDEPKQEAKPAGRTAPKPSETKAAPVEVTSGNQQGQQDQQQDDEHDGGERVPDYNGQALLAEFSEALDGFESVEAIDEWLGKTKGKPNLGMVIVEALNPGDQQEAREIYRQAKARIEDHAASEQQAGDTDQPSADDDTFPGDRPSTHQAAEKAPADMNDAELQAYIRAWIEASTDAVVMKKRWFAEAELRDNLDPKVAGELRALWKKRSDELQPKA